MYCLSINATANTPVRPAPALQCRTQCPPPLIVELRVDLDGEDEFEDGERGRAWARAWARASHSAIMANSGEALEGTPWSGQSWNLTCATS